MTEEEFILSAHLLGWNHDDLVSDKCMVKQNHTVYFNRMPDNVANKLMYFSVPPGGGDIGERKFQTLKELANFMETLK